MNKTGEAKKPGTTKQVRKKLKKATENKFTHSPKLTTVRILNFNTDGSSDDGGESFVLFVLKNIVTKKSQKTSPNATSQPPKRASDQSASKTKERVTK